MTTTSLYFSDLIRAGRGGLSNSFETTHIAVLPSS